MTTYRKPIALALSGGGIRAMVFHIGVLRHLAERGLLESVKKVSTVSGGSLLVGLLLQQNGLRWPTSEQFLSRTLPSMRKDLCTRSLQWGSVRQLWNPGNWRFLLSRANLLALALENEWHVQGVLSDLPETPDWSINGTTAESGKRFRFKRKDIGDYTLGYAPAATFPLSNALAVSAAFPGGFGPLTLNTRQFEWRKRPWDAPADSAQAVQPDCQHLHLYDGGVYDNIGLEPFFDVGRQKTKVDGYYIVCSDAGALLAPGFSKGPLNVFRLKRVADIMSDQSRSLRVRAFANYIQRTPMSGAYLNIGGLMSSQLTGADAQFAATFPTTLRRLNTAEFERIVNHGANVADHVRKEFGLCEEV
jgi:NTE family protein